jgi:putative membrane protein
LGLVLAGTARAETPQADQQFAEKAAAGGMAEVEMGKLAGKNGQSADVKKFGKKMVTDHTKANNELKKLAKKKSLNLPTAMTADQKTTYDRLAAMKGADFDTAYMDAMVKDHDEDVADFKKEADGGQDADLKAWAGKTLPVLQTHDDMAHKSPAAK